jgi:hypothetical protein
MKTLARISYVLMLVAIGMLMSTSGLGPSTIQFWTVMFAIVGSYILGRMWKEKR